MTQKCYNDRDIIGLDEKGGYYIRHIMAMTGEGLHSKSDIAAELAFRDAVIDDLLDQVAELNLQLGAKEV